MASAHGELIGAPRPGCDPVRPDLLFRRKPGPGVGASAPVRTVPADPILQSTPWCARTELFAGPPDRTL